jgi:hypothetical protein
VLDSEPKEVWATMKRLGEAIIEAKAHKEGERTASEMLRE